MTNKKIGWEDRLFRDYGDVGTSGEDIIVMTEKQAKSFLQDLLDSQRKEIVGAIKEKLIEDIDYWSNVKDIDGVDILKYKLIPKELVKRNINDLLGTLEQLDKEAK